MALQPATKDNSWKNAGSQTGVHNRNDGVTLPSVYDEVMVVATYQGSRVPITLPKNILSQTAAYMGTGYYINASSNMYISFQAYSDEIVCRGGTVNGQVASNDVGIDVYYR